jgi:DNA-binding XRE family transcriptional regulator
MYSINGLTYYPINNPGSIIDNLPAKVFSVRFDSLTSQYYLEYRFDNFPMPSQLYNCNDIDNVTMANLFNSRYATESGNLGVLLSGLKGTGKSLLLKTTANQALASGLPVILVEQSFSSSSLVKFLSSITEDCVVLFDEFEKYFYDDSEAGSNQAELLSFFDGTSVSHKLIIITVNNKDQLSEFFINRPSRIRYVIDYVSLSQEFVAEYVSQKLVDKSAIPAVLEEFEAIDEINFDLLNVCCDEVNKSYPLLPVKQIFRFLNIEVTKTTYVSYEVESYIDNQLISTDIIYSFDFDDFNHVRGEYVNISDMFQLSSYLERMNIHDASVRFNRANTRSIKGRDLMEATIKPDTRSKDVEVPTITFKLKRIRHRNRAF